MKCGSCTYWDDDICYKKGTRVHSNNNICEYFINQYITTKYDDEYIGAYKK